MLGKILGVIVANHLKCDKCVRNIYSKAYRKLSTLVRVIKLRSFHKRCTVFKTFSQSQFKYNTVHLCDASWKTNKQLNKETTRKIFKSCI